MRKMRINKSKRSVTEIDRALERRTLDAERANAGTLGKQMMATVDNRFPAEQQIAKLSSNRPTHMINLAAGLINSGAISVVIAFKRVSDLFDLINFARARPKAIDLLEGN